MVVKLCPVVVVSKSGIVKKMQTLYNFYHQIRSKQTPEKKE